MSRILTSFRGLMCMTALAAALVALPPGTARAERPTAAHLFPKNTVVYVRVTDATEFGEQLKKSSIGKIGEEEGVKQFVDGLYEAVEAAYAEIEPEIGLSLDEILKLPQGEVAFGVIQPEEGRAKVALLVDVGDYEVNARKLIERGEELATRDGGRTTSEVFKEVKLNIVERNRRPNEDITWFMKESTVVLSNSTEICRTMLEAWSELEEVETLADNTNFATIMKRCSGSDGARPQFTWFVDPINLARTVARGENAGFALAFIPATGLDGIRGIGGSTIMHTDDFESIDHIHVLLDSPRKGLVNALALGSGDTKPEKWVPAEAASYVTMHWDFNEMYLAIEKVYDSFTNDGALHDMIANNVDRNLGVSFFDEILPALGGRVTMTSYIVDPPRWNSQASVFGVKLTDPAAFQKTLDKVMERFPMFKKERFATTSYYVVEVGDDNELFAETLRRPEPCFCVLGDYLLYTDSVKVLEQAVMANGDPSRSLASQADYKEIAERVDGILEGEPAGLFAFGRPDKILKLFYEMSQTDQTRSFVRNWSEGASNPFATKLSENLERNKLPPFSAVARHLAPTGAVLTNDETGFHYTAFSLNPKSE